MNQPRSAADDWLLLVKEPTTSRQLMTIAHTGLRNVVAAMYRNVARGFVTSRGGVWSLTDAGRARVEKLLNTEKAG